MRSATDQRVIPVVSGCCRWKALDSLHLELFAEDGWTEGLDRVSNELAVVPYCKWRDAVTVGARARSDWGYEFLLKPTRFFRNSTSNGATRPAVAALS